MATTKAKTSSAKGIAPESPLIEWVVSGIGLILVGATVGYMLFAAFTKDHSPPDIQVDLISVVPLRQGYLAQFRATNHGDQSASGVQITGVHGEGPGAEESEAMIDFLPAQSEKRGGLFFSREPSPASLSMRASGYQEP